MSRILTEHDTTADPVCHVAGPVESDGVQRCLRCDAPLKGKLPVGQYVMVRGLTSRRIHRSGSADRFACQYQA